SPEARWHRRTPRSAASKFARGRSRTANASTRTAALHGEVRNHTHPTQRRDTVLHGGRHPGGRGPEGFNSRSNQQESEHSVDNHGQFLRGLDQRLESPLAARREQRVTETQAGGS